MKNWKTSFVESGIKHFSNKTVVNDGIILKSLDAICETRRTIPRMKPFWPNIIRLDPEGKMSRNFYQMPECNFLNYITKRLGTFFKYTNI